MTPSARVQVILARLTGSPLFWVLFVFTLFALPLGRSLARTLPPAPTVLGEVEPFELSDQYGNRMGSTQLEHHVWVATVMGTDAPGSQIEAVRNVIHRARNMGSTFHMVTLAADGDVDTEAARRALVEKYCSSAVLWSFLGGTKEEVDRATRALYASVGAGPADQLALVDGHGRIRGLYGTDKASTDRLMDDMGYVANLP